MESNLLKKAWKLFEILFGGGGGITAVFHVNYHQLRYKINS